MKKLILVILLSIGAHLNAQESLEITLKDSSRLKLTSLNIEVKIIGNFASTTYDMKFFNGLDRTLEGELVFPLGEGQAVSRFAMEVNDKLREAVIVEKELARVAFESTIRQNIDPGLLEKTEGNNYKARIYPILPKKHKHVVLTFEQELSTLNRFQTFTLPLGINEVLDDFSVNIEIMEGQGLPKVVSTTYKNLYFKEERGVFKLNLSKQNHSPENPIIIRIPNKSGENILLTHNDYFYAYQTLKPKSRLKAKPNKITLLWDASYSMRHRNLDRELDLLNDYFRYLQNAEVRLISFSNTIHRDAVFSVENGNWDVLKEEIRGTGYDGGTAMNIFGSLKLKSDEMLLFSDGMANLGDFASKYDRSIYPVNSIVSANHEALGSTAMSSGGSYVNLVRMAHVEAVKVLKQEVFQFLGADYDKSISEIYPRGKVNVSEDFSIAGRFGKETTLELLFGYQGKITERIEVPIKKCSKTKLVKRLWAKEKLNFLNQNKEQNQDKIIALAKRHYLVTDYTSMLILDRIEDYVRYRIEPPHELKAEYKQRIKNMEREEADKQEYLKNRKVGLFHSYEDLLDWYATKYPKNKTKVTRPTGTNGIDQDTPTTQRDTDTVVDNSTGINRPTSAGIDINIDSTRNIVSGTVMDASNLPLPGANVVVKGTTSGTTTDFDGNFSINAEANDELVFSYIGFLTAHIVIEGSDSISISLEEDAALLEEVVVTGYGSEGERETTASVTSVVSRSGQNKTAGVYIAQGREEEGLGTTAAVRGATSGTDDGSPLYIVDGEIVPQNPMQELKPADIEGVQVLKALSASAIYGVRAANGVIIITTKKGMESNQEAIEKLDQEIAEKIELKSWNPDTPYLKILENEATTESAYNKYLEIRDDYSNSPSFYLDVSDFFEENGNPYRAITILTNLMEIELNDHEIMKALAYKLEYFKEYDLAVTVYKKVLELRPEEPQSYRDLALAYELSGRTKESFELLHKLYEGELLEKDEGNRFYGIERIAFVELTRLVKKYGTKLKLDDAQKEEFKEIPVDIRIVIDWNHNDTDIDLWVEDPQGEKAYYKNPKTKMGGLMSKDMTEGYGPEEFMIKKASSGAYKVSVDYYADNVQKISGPTVLKVTLFTNYGKANEERKTTIKRLDKGEDEIEVGSLKF